MQGDITQKFWGVVLITIGGVLILHQFGILKQRMDFYIIIFLALYLITRGLMKINGTDYIKKFTQKQEEQR